MSINEYFVFTAIWFQLPF